MYACRSCCRNRMAWLVAYLYIYLFLLLAQVWNGNLINVKKLIYGVFDFPVLKTSSMRCLFFFFFSSRSFILTNQPFDYIAATAESVVGNTCRYFLRVKPPARNLYKTRSLPACPPALAPLSISRVNVASHKLSHVSLGGRGAPDPF